jgi:hypothetical protein
VNTRDYKNNWQGLFNNEKALRRVAEIYREPLTFLKSDPPKIGRYVIQIDWHAVRPPELPVMCDYISSGSWRLNRSAVLRLTGEYR